MHLGQLRHALHDFCVEASAQLAADAQSGQEIPFEVVEAGRRGAPLYCYRPLTTEFIIQRGGVLGRLATYLPAAHAIVAAGGLDAYLEAQGVHAPPAGRDRADGALFTFLGRVFEDSTDFVFDEHRFARAYDNLVGLVADGRTETVVAARLLGVQLESDELVLGDGLSLVRAESCAEAPDAARWGGSDAASGTLALLRWEPAPGDDAPLQHARVRLRRMLVGLRLYAPFRPAFAPLAWTKTGAGPWQPLALGPHLAPAGDLRVAALQEDELRAFLSLVGRRTPSSGPVAWALRRFELASERPQAAEALSDVLLALRALLEPEGPAAGRIEQRLAALCAEPASRDALRQRVAHAVSLERGVIAGLPGDPQLDALTGELGSHLRALLRDVLCGHLDPDLRAVADTLLAGEAAAAAAAQADPERAPAEPAQATSDFLF